ncbi:hypothetical protein AB1N83_001043 [Pleurotus pulmonarius]
MRVFMGTCLLDSGSMASPNTLALDFVDWLRTARMASPSSALSTAKSINASAGAKRWERLRRSHAPHPVSHHARTLAHGTNDARTHERARTTTREKRTSRVKDGDEGPQTKEREGETKSPNGEWQAKQGRAANTNRYTHECDGEHAANGVAKRPNDGTKPHQNGYADADR